MYLDKVPALYSRSGLSFYIDAGKMGERAPDSEFAELGKSGS